MNLADAVPDPTMLHEVIRQVCSNTWSETHGEEHWRRVAKAGLRLCQSDDRIDPAVVYLFAAFHDSERLTDHSDDVWHGPRAAVLATKLRGGPFDLESWQMGLLVHACNFHTHEEQIGTELVAPKMGDTLNSASLTVGACYDADRLNLMRVGKVPDPYYLTTQEAMREETLLWATDTIIFDECESWEELHAQFCALQT